MELNVTSVFLSNWNDTRKFLFNRGGTGSGKTFAILQLAFIWLFSGCYGRNQTLARGTFTIVRREYPYLREGCLEPFKDMIDRFGLWGLVEYDKVEKVIRYGSRRIQFLAIDEHRKAKSLRRELIYFNELNEFPDMDIFNELTSRTSTKVYADWNPDNAHHWVKTFLEDYLCRVEPDDHEVFITTYRDNPYLHQETVKQIERYKKTNPERWKIHGEARYGMTEGLIHKYWKPVDVFPEDYDFRAFGVDTGLTDETAIVELRGIRDPEDPKHYKLYFKELMYKSFANTPSMIRAMEMNPDLDKKTIMYVDSNPKAIYEAIKDAGYHTRKVMKTKSNGKDYVLTGIEFLNKNEVYMFSGSKNLLNEQASYSWKKDVTGNRLLEPDKRFKHHLLDACRYAVTRVQRGRTKVLGVVQWSEFMN